MRRMDIGTGKGANRHFQNRGRSPETQGKSSSRPGMDRLAFQPTHGSHRRLSVGYHPKLGGYPDSDNHLFGRRKMIVRTQVTFLATGERFTPSKVAAQYSQSHDPGVIGTRGRYRGVQVPYGSADFDAPEKASEKIKDVHRRAFPFLSAMRDAGAQDFCLHITYHYDSQCALSFSQEELRMILELDCHLNIDC